MTSTHHAPTLGTRIAEALFILLFLPPVHGVIEGYVGLIPALVAGICILILPNALTAAIAGGIAGIAFGGLRCSKPIEAFWGGGRCPRCASKWQAKVQYAVVAAVAGVLAGLVHPISIAQDNWLEVSVVWTLVVGTTGFLFPAAVSAMIWLVRYAFIVVETNREYSVREKLHLMLNSAETEACRQLVVMAFQEDLGGEGDLTSLAIIPAEKCGKALLVARSAGVIAGLPVAALVADNIESELFFDAHLAEGKFVPAGTHIASISGPMRALLTAERTALNFLQRLSGVATLTRQYADAVAGLPVQILDTRKTTPGWRLLEKYAVRCGGGHNHRVGLYDGILIKDNHIAALGGGTVGVVEAIRKARLKVGWQTVPVEVEVDSLDQLDAALPERPDIILLDNMSLEQMREAVRRRNAIAPEIKLEASGGVNLTTVRAIAETGVDRISVGALTHSAVALDIGLDYEAN